MQLLRTLHLDKTRAAGLCVTLRPAHPLPTGTVSNPAHPRNRSKRRDRLVLLTLLLAAEQQDF